MNEIRQKKARLKKLSHRVAWLKGELPEWRAEAMEGRKRKRAGDADSEEKRQDRLLDERYKRSFYRIMQMSKEVIELKRDISEIEGGDVLVRVGAYEEYLNHHKFELPE